MPTPPRPTLASKRKALQGQVMQQVGLFDRLADPLLQITGRKGRIKWANQAAYDLLGNSLVDRRMAEVFAAKELKPTLKNVREEKLEDAELIVQPRNLPGREFRVRLARLDKKTVYGARILVSLTDVTQILQLQAQRADFVANTSHELKTPVAALSGFIETLQNDPGALNTFLPIMAKETARMRALIDDLLNLTKTEMQTHEALTQQIDTHPLLDQALEGVKASLQARQQTLRRTGTLTAAKVQGDPTGLITVFSNLANNASTYAPSGSTLEVKVETTQSTLRIHFHNEGPGIAPKHIPRLTERFYRADTSRTQGGTGLGLAIVKHVLIRHRGELLITSEKGKGAKFTVCLPLINPL